MSTGNLGRNGFRQPSTKDTIRQLSVEVQNLNMAGRVSQTLIQQLLQNNRAMSEDLGRAMGLINELQYKILAVQKTANLDVDEMTKIADDLRLKDFNEASDGEDLKENFTVTDTVEEDSTVILTSVVEGTDKGIFRSRIKLADCGVPELIKELLGKQVGTKVTVSLNNVSHIIELLAVRKPQPEVIPSLPHVEEVALPAQV